MAIRTYQTGPVQMQVLEALGFEGVNDYREAERIFEELGLIVTPVKQGDTYIPSITYAPRINRDGKDWFIEYVTLTPEQEAAIGQWIA